MFASGVALEYVLGGVGVLLHLGSKGVLEMSSDVRVIFHGQVPHEDRVRVARLEVNKCISK